jgi:iron complex outermembrane receptor protein
LAWLGVPLDTIKKDPRFNQSSDEKDNFTQMHLQLHYQYTFKRSQFNTCAFYNFLRGNYDFDLNNFLDLPRNNEMYNYALKANFLGWFSNYSVHLKNLTLTSGVHLNQYTREHIGTERTLGWLYANTGYKNEFSGFLRASQKIGKFSLYGDCQYRHADFEYKGDQKLPSFNWNFINYTAGANYQITDFFNLYYSFGKTNREPTRNDIFLGNDNLITDSLSKPWYAVIKPEKALDHEVGMRYTHHKIMTGINFYYIPFKDEIGLNGEIGPTGLPLHSNSARSFRSGIEIDFSYSLENGLSFTTNASFSSNKIEDSGAHIKPILSPAKIINQNIRYHFKNVRIEISARYQGKSYIDYGNTYTIPEFLIIGSNIGYTYKWISLNLSIQNLTNKQYYANGNLDINNQPVYFVQAPINYFGGITCTF